MLAKQLCEALPGLPLRENEPMRDHCSFRVGGPAEVFAEPRDEGELAALLRLLGDKDLRPTVIGNGTNLLVRDEGIPGVVIHIGEALGGVRFEDETVFVGAGVPLSRLACLARDQGLSGLEFAHGIPGSLGGALVMNAGAYGGEMQDVTVSVRYLDASGVEHETTEPGFSYRKSRFSSTSELVLSATLRLTPGDPAKIQERMRTLQEKRSASQPLEKPSAGSTFKRPAQGYAAAMIDGAGLKGRRVGGAQVSEKHAGFLINAGGATCADVLALMELVRETVYQAYGVWLEPEVKVLG